MCMPLPRRLSRHAAKLGRRRDLLRARTVAIAVLAAVLLGNICVAQERTGQAWIDGNASQPPQGQQRVIVDGRRHLQLPANAPRAALAFEMEYALLGMTEQPLQQPSPLLRGLPRVEPMQETYRIRAADRAQEVELLSTPPRP